jgi:transposase InsO family protein
LEDHIVQQVESLKNNGYQTVFIFKNAKLNYLDQAFDRLADGEKPLIQSNQDWHYRMSQYQHEIKKRNLIQSMSCKGNCYDNAVM